MTVIVSTLWSIGGLNELAHTTFLEQWLAHGECSVTLAIILVCDKVRNYH